MAVTALLPLVLTVLVGRGTANTHWSYSGPTGPQNWGKLHIDGNQCSSDSKQSPVEILTDYAIYSRRLDDLEFMLYHEPLRNPYIVNNGHTAMVVEEDSPRFIERGGLPGKYIFAQLHFHWGSDNTRGSEHFVDGRQYPMELHLVHYKEDYGSVAEALRNSDGIAVVAVYFEVSRKHNNQYMNLISELQNIRTMSDRGVPIQRQIVLNNLLPRRSKDFFRYNGSLTTPPCSEAVIFSLFRETVPLSAGQLEQFRKLRVGNETSPVLVDNYRPLQPLRGRTVLRNFRSSARPQTEVHVGLVSLLLFLLASGGGWWRECGLLSI
uniref:Carbonic anhydrase n=1 Tax=Ornithodoros turicata TaxID=34597 RepID=A0A2R5L769_9ACAR